MIDLGRISHLQDGHAEQHWIEQHLASGPVAPALAFIDYRQPCLIYGRRGGDPEAAHPRALASGFAVTRRRSGGGAVLAGPWMLGANLLLPKAHPGAQLSHVQAFTWFGRCWQQALATLGANTHMAVAQSFEPHLGRVRQLGLEWVCFAGISHGELLDQQGRKVLGLAQYRGRWGTLLSAGLLVGTPPWEQLEFVQTGHTPKQSALHTLTAPLTSLDCQAARETLQANLLCQLHTPL